MPLLNSTHPIHPILHNDAHNRAASPDSSLHVHLLHRDPNETYALGPPSTRADSKLRSSMGGTLIPCEREVTQCGRR